MNRPWIAANGGATSRMVVAHGGQLPRVAVRTKKMMVVIKAPELYQILTPKTHSPLFTSGWLHPTTLSSNSESSSLMDRQFYNELVGPNTQQIQVCHVYS